MAAMPQCTICGADIQRSSGTLTWQHRFRAVRKRNGQESTPFLTGIGDATRRFGDPRFRAPSDPDLRFDDALYVFTSADEFRAFIADRFERYPGFPFHEACWKLLKAMMHPQDVPIELLYYICYSFPIRHEHWLDWGHTYGGLVTQKPADHYPWERLRIYQLITRVLGMSILSPLHSSKHDPYEIPELKQVLECLPVEDAVSVGTISAIFRGQKDCFSRLPVEICEEILMPLSSRDVVNLRMASRSFARITLSQSFWKSRFGAGFEREYMFELSMGNGSHTIPEATRRDWRALYHYTSATGLSSRGLANRQRIWKSCRPLVDILKSNPLEMFEPTGLENVREWSWRGVGGETVLETPFFFNPSIPCKVFRERAVPLPSEVLEILVSTVNFHDKVYVTGLWIVAQGQPNTGLGFILPGRETHIDLRTKEGKPGVITGFITAVDANGIRGFRVTLLDGRVSEWAGQGDDIPTTLRLCTDKPISHLKGGFDGFKMVWLSIPYEQPQSGDPASLLPLRTTALWYPSISPDNHFLHDSSFPGKALPLTQYRPLIRVMFGGPNGSYLRYLTKITATVSKGFVAGLDFQYETPGSPIGIIQACRGTNSADNSVKIPFKIDGPGGEILTGMQVKDDFWSPGQNGAVVALTVTTSRGRKFTFEPSAIPRLRLPAGPRLPKKPGKIEIQPGTTMTGIYVMHDGDVGMVSLGPISEILGA